MGEQFWVFAAKVGHVDVEVAQESSQLFGMAGERDLCRTEFLSREQTHSHETHWPTFITELGIAQLTKTTPLSLISYMCGRVGIIWNKLLLERVSLQCRAAKHKRTHKVLQ